MANSRDRNVPEMTTNLNDYSKSVNLAAFVNSRKSEMQILKNNMENKQSSKRVFQLVPNFLRRRGASYNSNKLPLRLRKLGKAELIKENRKPRKRSSRLKLRFCSLKRDYQRRQKNGKWLETHLWHAKRSKMAKLWNYKLCLSPNAGGKKSGYRLHKERCNIVDTSYIGTIELIGDKGLIAKLLENFIDPASNSFQSKRYATGKRQGSCHIYEKGSYPQNYLGPVDFLWNSSPENPSDHIWLFVHPSFYNTFYQQLSTAISNSLEFSKIQLKDLRNELCQVTLFGPKALQTIDRSFNLVSNQEINQLSVSKVWSDLVLSIRSQSSLPPQAVLGMEIYDPRLSVVEKLHAYESSLESQRESLSEAQSSQIAQLLANWPLSLSNSKIWSNETRENVKNRKLTDSIINQRRSQALIPGGNIETSDKDVKIPILIVNQSNSNEISSLIRHASIKVILPSGWGKVLWNRLVFCGARHQGQWYLKKVASFSSRNLYFPLDYPSTEAYREFSGMVQNTLKQRYDRTPPAKRINYSLLNVKYPFGVDFDQFIWDNLDAEKLPPCLLFTNSIIKNISLLIQQSNSTNILTQIESLLSPLYLASQKQYTNLSFASYLSTVLIPVICTSDSKGLCNDYSIIYKRSANTSYSQGSSSLTIKQQQDVIPNNDDIIGYITNGGFCPQSGKGVGIGWIKLKSLIEYTTSSSDIIRLNQNKIMNFPILIRNPTSFTCRPATAELLK